jgi:Flp pilus assembly pilin Flp
MDRNDFWHTGRSRLEIPSTARERGAALFETVLLVSLVAVATIVSARALGNTINENLNGINQTIGSREEIYCPLDLDDAVCNTSGANESWGIPNRKPKGTG